MSLPSNKKFSGIFVSYRRDDTAGHTGRLFDRLVEHFGRERIFMDIDTIEPGEDFVTVIENAVSSCDVLIAVIGRNWLTTGGTPRLDNLNDFVRIELATALRRDIRVIPVLVQRAAMPQSQDLPEDLIKLSRRNAVELSDLRWQGDVDQLIAVMERVLNQGAEHHDGPSHEVVSEVPLREASRPATEHRSDEPPTVVTTAAASPVRKKRIFMIAGAALIVLLAAAFMIFRSQGDQTSSDNLNQTIAAQPSVTEQPTAATPTPTPEEPKKPPIDIELVFAPRGGFMMGSDEIDGEAPVHEVTFTEGFFIGKYEVTQAQWKAVMGNNPSYFKNCDNCPVENITWLEVQDFLKALNAISKKYTYRLPSEAEWEYACRAGSSESYAGQLSDMAWYVENSESKTQPVGSKAPNAFGLHDMHGNVWEWCEDVHYSGYEGAPTDGSVWKDGEGSERMVRGGSWSDPAPTLKSAHRGWNPARKREPIVGFRVVAISQ